MKAQGWRQSLFSGLQVRLSLLVVLTVIPALALNVYTAWEQERVEKIQAQEIARFKCAPKISPVGGAGTGASHNRIA